MSKAKKKPKRGFPDSETWSLDSTLAQWLLPRLRRFREVENSTPSQFTDDQWESILAELEWAFGFAAENPEYYWPDEKDAKRFDKAMRLFAKHFRDLWW